MNTLVLPYKAGSESSKLLSSTLGCKRMKLENSSVKDREDLTIINWGNSHTDLSHLPSVKIINRPSQVKLASHKLKFFERIEEDNSDSFVPTNIPEWTTNMDQAKQWYEEGNDIVARHVLQGHSGDGIELVHYKSDVPSREAVSLAPLYTKYMKKRDEFRVHVFNNVPILVQRKANKFGVKPSCYQIRNHSNGFIYQISDVSPDASVISQAVNAVTVLGLDFGAVDVIWNERKKKATVLEVNTACGLSGGTTLARYNRAFRSFLDGEAIQDWKSTMVEEELRHQADDDASPRGSVVPEMHLKLSLDMLPNHPEDCDEFGCEDGVILENALHVLMQEYEIAGGRHVAIIRYLEDFNIGGNGGLYIQDINEDGDWARLGFASDDGDYDIFPYYVPVSHLTYTSMT